VNGIRRNGTDYWQCCL